MKIWLAAIDAYGGGGITTHLKNLSKGLVSYEHEVQWITPNGKIVEDLSNVVLSINKQLIKPYPNNWSVDVIETWSLRLLINLELLLQVDKPDIIHCHDVITFNRIKLTAERYEIPIILTVHGYIPEEEVYNEHIKENSLEYHYWRKTELFAMKEADNIISVGSALKEYLLSVYPEAQIKIVPNFIDNDFSIEEINKDDIRRKLNIPENAFLIFCPSRFAFNKGVEYLIRALNYTPENTYLLLVDHGNSELYNEIQRCFNNERIVVINPIQNEMMSALYKAADICVIPSITSGRGKETSSYTAIESMECDIPVVASDIGGLAEVIGEFGIKVPEKDSKAISNAIIQLIDKENYNYWKKKCVTRKAEFSSRKIIPRIINIYEETIKKERYIYHTPFNLYGFSSKVLFIIYSVILGDYKSIKNVLDMAQIRFGLAYREALLESTYNVCISLPEDYYEIRQNVVAYIESIK